MLSDWPSRNSTNFSLAVSRTIWQRMQMVSMWQLKSLSAEQPFTERQPEREEEEEEKGEWRQRALAERSCSSRGAEDFYRARFLFPHVAVSFFTPWVLQGKNHREFGLVSAFSCPVDDSDSTNCLHCVCVVWKRKTWFVRSCCVTDLKLFLKLENWSVTVYFLLTPQF